MVCPSPLRSNQAFSLASTVQHEVVFDDRSREHLVPLYPATIQLPKDTALFWPPEGPSNNGHLMVHQSTAPTSVISLTDAFSPSSLATMNQPTCCGCGIPIQDRFLLKVMEQTWHEQCLQCSVCHMQLLGSCFFKNGRFFCRLDYQR
jgi:hypothetical protein